VYVTRGAFSVTFTPTSLYVNEVRGLIPTPPEAIGV
jgi:hypothetical protein